MCDWVRASCNLCKLVTIPATNWLLPGMLPHITSQILLKHNIRWIVLHFRDKPFITCQLGNIHCNVIFFLFVLGCSSKSCRGLCFCWIHCPKASVRTSGWRDLWLVKHEIFFFLQMSALLHCLMLSVIFFSDSKTCFIIWLQRRSCWLGSLPSD